MPAFDVDPLMSLAFGGGFQIVAVSKEERPNLINTSLSND